MFPSLHLQCHRVKERWVVTTRHFHSLSQTNGSVIHKVLSHSIREGNKDVFAEWIIWSGSPLYMVPLFSSCHIRQIECEIMKQSNHVSSLLLLLPPKFNSLPLVSWPPLCHHCLVSRLYKDLPVPQLDLTFLFIIPYKYNLLSTCFIPDSPSDPWDDSLKHQ